MKFFNLLLLVVTSANKCLPKSLCGDAENACTCGTGDNKNCNSNSLCIDPNTDNNMVLIANQLDAFEKATNNKTYCIKTGENINTANITFEVCANNDVCDTVNGKCIKAATILGKWQQGETDIQNCIGKDGHNTCDALSKCNNDTGACIPITTIVDGRNFSYGEKIECLTKKHGQVKCAESYHVCDISTDAKNMKSKSCIEVATDINFLHDGDADPKACVINRNLSDTAPINIVRNGVDNNIKYKVADICRANQKCVKGQCLTKCKPSVVCGSNNPCVCTSLATENDCNTTNQYCLDGELSLIDGKFLSHKQEGDSTGALCVKNRTTSDDTQTIAKACSKEELCNIYAENVNDLCKDKLNRISNYAKATNTKKNCWYKSGVTDCHYDDEDTQNTQICNANATELNDACLTQIKLIAYMLKDNGGDSGNEINEQINQLSTLIGEKCGGGGETNEEDTKNAKNATKATSDGGVYGIAIGALTVGVINLFLIGGVLVLLLCFNNNKGGKPAKEAA